MQSLIGILSNSYSYRTKHLSTCRKRVQLNRTKDFELLHAFEVLEYMEEIEKRKNMRFFVFCRWAKFSSRKSLSRQKRQFL